MAKRRKYTEEFERDAVRLMRNRGARTVAQVADDLGVPPNQLHRWAAKYERQAVAKRSRDRERCEGARREIRDRKRFETRMLGIDRAGGRHEARVVARAREPRNAIPGPEPRDLTRVRLQNGV